MEGPPAPSGTATEERLEVNGSAPSTPAPPAKKKMSRSRRVALVLLLIVVLLAAGAGGAYYFIESSKYVSTDNAQVDGDKIQIVAPTTGTLIDWRITQGTEVRKDQVVGRIEMQAGFAQPQRTIRAPGNGTVAVNNGVEGSWVTAGTQLATAYDFSNIYVTARVDETDVGAVHPGALVDIEVDAYPDTPVTGLVEEVQGAAAGVFSLFPESNSTGNFQKVTQVIPVKIVLTNTNGAALVPGMNVEVKIHKKNQGRTEWPWQEWSWQGWPWEH